MSIIPIQSGNPFQELTRLFAETADGNRDGQVSNDEFATFLANLLQSLNNRPNGTAAAPVGTTAGSTVVRSLTTLPMASESNRPHMSGFSGTKLAIRPTTHPGTSSDTWPRTSISPPWSTRPALKPSCSRCGPSSRLPA